MIFAYLIIVMLLITIGSLVFKTLNTWFKIITKNMIKEITNEMNGVLR